MLNIATLKHNTIKNYRWVKYITYKIIKWTNDKIKIVKYNIYTMQAYFHWEQLRGSALVNSRLSSLPIESEETI